jgi:diguanylate cyclase (GGDEF)-like protein
MIDVDRFKSINDNYGHLVGDYALVRVSKALKLACAPFEKRPYIARFGGDEFIVVLEGGEEDLNRLIKQINDEVRVQDEDTEYELSVSIGIAKYEESMTYDAFIEQADIALYKIKKSRTA